METIIEAVSRYIDTSSMRLKPSTLGIYRRYLESYIPPYFKNTPCDILTNKLAQMFVNKLITENELSVITKQSVFNILKASVLKTFNVKFPRRTKKSVEFLTVDEQKRIEQAAKNRNSTDYIAIMLCLYTGVRIGEVCGLRWTDISFERKSLQINRTIQRIRSNGNNKTEIAFLAPKSDTSERVIPLPDFLLDILREHKALSKTECVISYKRATNSAKSFQENS